MCFSATASFTAGTALVAVGGLTVSRSRGKAELPLVLVPLLFGVQQITEGGLWIALNHHLAGLQSWTTYIFSLFSHVLWPIWVPLAILLVETHRTRRTLLGIFQAVGLTVGLYLLYFLISSPVSARIHQNSIFYDSPHFYLGGIVVLYLSATCLSGLFSSHRCINVFGLLAFALAILAYEISVKTFVSVWCFYAAVLSLLIFVHFSGPMQACRPAHEPSLESAEP
jgi:hypothetical protein